ncbi:hypothetical protein CON22_24970 [Bacillus cereus]|nr:hypothetical protein CON22_24970 [Bacillus cereus]
MKFYENIAIIKSMDFSEILTSNNVMCIQCKPKDTDFNYYIFTCDIESEEELLLKYEVVNDTIALDWQSTLSKNIEKWNIYLFYFLKNEVSDKTRYMVEQNKYSTRKIVYFTNNKSLNFEEKTKVIINKLFTINLVQNTNGDFAYSLEDLIDKEEPNLKGYLNRYPNQKELNKKSGLDKRTELITDYLVVNKVE